MDAEELALSFRGAMSTTSQGSSGPSLKSQETSIYPRAVVRKQDFIHLFHFFPRASGKKTIKRRDDTGVCQFFLHAPVNSLCVIFSSLTHKTQTVFLSLHRGLDFPGKLGKPIISHVVHDEQVCLWL